MSGKTGCSQLEASATDGKHAADLVAVPVNINQTKHR
jgi:hypothetical protein